MAGGPRRGGRAAAPEPEPVTPATAPNLPALNFRITDEVGLGIGKEAEKFNDNIAAIETLKEIERENRRATPEEQRKLARYVGWGGLANAFRQPTTKEFKPEWKERGERLEGLLTPEEIRLASNSTQNAHYTSQAVVEAMWAAAQRLGFKGGLALETSVGTGNFLGLVPESLAGATRFVAIERDSITSRIAQLLYPQDTVLNSPTERVPLPDGEFVLSIGNPPFGGTKLRWQYKPDLNGFTIHNQFFLAALDALRPGGLHIAVVSRYLLDQQTEDARLEMAIRADMLGAIRLPETAFKENARTEVVTDIVFFQRRTPSEEAKMREAVDAYKTRPRNRTDQEQKRQELADQVPEWVKTEKIDDPLGGEAMTVNSYFANNNRMVLGKMDRSGTMRQAGDLTVTLPKDANIADLLAKAVARLPSDVMDLTQDIIDRTRERQKSMGESLELALSGKEPGHVEIGKDGKLYHISERETPGGDFEVIRRVLTPESPWSRRLYLDKDGNWYTLEPISKAQHLRNIVAELRAEADRERAIHGADAGVINSNEETLRAQANMYEQLIPEAEISKAKAKTDEGRLIYKPQYYPDGLPPRLKLGDTNHDRLGQLVKLRDLTKQQLVLESTDAPAAEMEANRTRLSTAYKEYTRKNGLLNGQSNASLLSEMPDGALVLALETSYRRGVTAAKAKRTGAKAVPPSAKPAAILSRRVVPKWEPVQKADSPADAVSISLSDTGTLNIPRIAGLLGVTEPEAIVQITDGDKPLAYLNPETNTYETSHDYLTGNVAKKLNAARAAGLEKNAAALEKVQPEPWTADQITVLPGANWVPPEVYSDFVSQTIGGDQIVLYTPASNQFSLSITRPDHAKNQQWSAATDRNSRDFEWIFERMLNSQPLVVRETDQDGVTYVDQELTALIDVKAGEITNEFSDWVFRQPERRAELVKIFNDKFNTRVTRQHDGSHLQLPGKVPDEVISLRRHQKNAVWRGIHERLMLLDHVVGAGKTFTAIARAMERRRMGLSRKPMVVVPNHLVQQWTADIYRLYPSAKVLAAGPNQFDSKGRRKLFARIATGDWDIVVVPHSSFKFIGVSPEAELRFLEEELRIALAAVEAAQEAAAAAGLQPTGPRRAPNVKQAEQLVTKLEGKIDKRRGKVKRERLLTFEQMGIDDLTVDELHEFKNLFYSTRSIGIRGMGPPSGSERAFDLYVKLKILRETPTGTVTFLSGTPISNSAVEMYTMMRYLAADELKELGLEHFDGWRTQSVSATSAFEPTESGSGLKEVTRLGRQWSNMRALMNLYYGFTDAVTQEDITKWHAEDNNGEPFPVPRVKGGERQSVVIKPTAAQREILQGVIAGFNALPSEPDPKERNRQRLRLMDRARKVSLDARAADPANTSKEKGGKLEVMTDNIYRIYKQHDADAGTQLVFLDRSVKAAKGDKTRLKEYDDLVARKEAALAKGDNDAVAALIDELDQFDPNEMEELRRAQAGGWNAYDQLKHNLVARGIPAEEIRFVQEANTDAEKKALFDDVNDGRIRVLIGSTPRMGAGTNVQERLVALHHGDVTWKPSDIEQREGRIIRQGNSLLEKHGHENFEVEILAYATENTIDAKMWDLNSTKLRMINGIRKYDGAFTMEFEDQDAVGMAEIAALASGDPMLLERVKLTSEIDRLELHERAHRRKQYGIDDQIERFERQQRDYPGLIKQVQEQAAEMTAELAKLKESIGKRRVTVEGKEFGEEGGTVARASAHKAAYDAMVAQQAGDDNAPYAVNIDGKRYTNKEDTNAAIQAGLGQDIEAVVDGKTLITFADVSKALVEKSKGIITDGQAVEPITIGSMLGGEMILEARPGIRAMDKGVPAQHIEVALSLDQGGRTVVSAEGLFSTPITTKDDQWVRSRPTNSPCRARVECSTGS